MPEFKSNLSILYRKHELKALIALLSVSLVAVVLWPLSVVQIDAGHVGTRWHRFGGGTNLKRTYSEGTHLIAPWDTMARYDIRVSTLKTDLSIQFTDQLSAHTTFTLVYSLAPERVNFIHKFFGPNFANNYLQPLLLRQINDAIHHFDEIDNVPTRRQEIQNKIAEDLMADFKTDGPSVRDQPNFIVYSVVMGEIQMPPELAKMIEAKHAERVRGASFIFRLQNETLEAERKLIEAKGIVAFHNIVSDALTDNYLKFEGIRATRDLSLSNNSKIVVFGNHAWGLPLGLDQLDQQRLPSANATAPPPALGAQTAPKTKHIPTEQPPMLSSTGQLSTVSPTTPLTTTLPTSVPVPAQPAAPATSPSPERPSK